MLCIIKKISDLKTEEKLFKMKIKKGMLKMKVNVGMLGAYLGTQHVVNEGKRM